VADTPTLQAQFNQLMPDYAGGVFDFVTRGSRLAAQHVQDDSSLFTISNVGGWFEPIYFHGGKQTTGTAGFSDHGFGLSGGLERVTGIGNVGLSLTWISGKVNTSSYQSVKTSNLEVGAFWRMAKGPFYAFARVGEPPFGNLRAHVHGGRQRHQLQLYRCGQVEGLDDHRIGRRVLWLRCGRQLPAAPQGDRRILSPARKRL
jgi:hypothetical protein